MLRSLIARLRRSGSTSGDDDRATGRSDVESTTDADSTTDAEPTGDADHDVADDPEDSNDLWDLIPTWEYNGKYVQSGGHARGEQERALEEIQRQADAIEASDDPAESSEQ